MFYHLNVSHHSILFQSIGIFICCKIWAIQDQLWEQNNVNSAENHYSHVWGDKINLVWDSFFLISLPNANQFFKLTFFKKKNQFF